MKQETTATSQARWLNRNVLGIGLAEGIVDRSSAVVKVWSGWYSDRITWRKQLGGGGYAATWFWHRAERGRSDDFVVQSSNTV